MTSIKLCSSYDRLYAKTLLKRTNLHLAGPSTEPTPHTLSADWSAIASEDVRAASCEFLLPFLQLDLEALGTGLHGKIPVYYHEMVFLECVVSQLDERGRVVGISFHGDEGPIDLAEELDGEDAFDEGIDEVLSCLQDLDERFLAVHEGPALPSAGFSSEQLDEYGEWSWNALYESVGSNHFPLGPFPVQVQSSLPIPSKADGEEGLSFVGRISTGVFDLADIDHFLFYDPENRIVAQVLQMS